MNSEQRFRIIVDRLHAENVGAYIELPQIAVMGDTSSGKSSLLSAISGIQFPSSDKLTTRCPTRLRMENTSKVSSASLSSTKKAEVGVKWHHTSAYASRDSYPRRELDSWDDIPQAVLDAQAFILSTAGRSVAPDIVEIAVWGPDLTDITVVDLPGIVRTVGKDEDDNIIADISALIQEFLVNERCIILAILPANVEYHNSQILQEAKRVDPRTRRTIGVITKPDCVDPGAESAVLQLLQGEKASMDHGFHMIKCRGQKAHNESKSLQDEREDEMRFFRTQAPWASMEDRSKLGVEALREKLSRIQVCMIEDSVPKILEEVDRRASIAQLRLQELGTDYDTESKRRAFFDDIKARSLTTVEGCMGVGGDGGRSADDVLGTDGLPWSTALHNLLDKFRDAVLQSKLASIDRIEVGNVVDASSILGPGKTAIVAEIEGEKLALDFPDDRSVSKEPLHVFEGSKWKYVWFPRSKVKPSNAWLKTLMLKHRNYDLPCFLNASVFASVVRDLVGHSWLPACESLLDGVVGLVTKVTDGMFELPRFSLLEMHLKKSTRTITTEFASKLRAALGGQMRRDIQQRPYTQNHYLFEIIAKKRCEDIAQKMEDLVKQFKESGVSYHATAQKLEDLLKGFKDERRVAVSTMESMLAVMTSHKDKPMIDHMVSEMEIVLEAYGKVAAKRVIDEIPRIIFESLEELCLRLREVMRVSDSDLTRWMQDKAETRGKRRRAEAELETMRRAREVFESIQIDV